MNKGLKSADIYKPQRSGSIQTHHHQKKKKFEAIVPADKVMASVFCNRCGIIHVDFLHRHVTINSDYYCHVLSDVQTRLSVEK